MVFKSNVLGCRYFDFRQQFADKRWRGPHKAWRRRSVLRLTSHLKYRQNHCYSIAIRKAHDLLNKERIARPLKYKSYNMLWRDRLDAGCAELGVPYNVLKDELRSADVMLNKKMLNVLAVHEPRSFRSLVQLTKSLCPDPGLNNLQGPPAGVVTRAMLGGKADGAHWSNVGGDPWGLSSSKS